MPRFCSSSKDLTASVSKGLLPCQASDNLDIIRKSNQEPKGMTKWFVKYKEAEKPWQEVLQNTKRTKS